MTNGTPSPSKVDVGFTTVAGILAALPGGFDLLFKAVQSGEHITVTGPDKYLVLLTIVSGAIVGIGRYAQAVVKQLKG